MADLLLWGTAFFMLIIGWAVTNGGDFELRSGDYAKQARAVGLILGSVVVGTSYRLALKTIYRHRLAGKSDPTLLPEKWVIGYATVLGAATFVVSVIMGWF
ncbi:MAG: hypothetical protein H7Y06_09545 [Opitutaceae bacterium]|nr:hypothetical protein [Opitutaceae bacterium]